MLDWIYSNETLLWWLVLLSVVSLLASLIIVPLVLTWIPADYFSHSARHRISREKKHPLLLIPFLLLKNLLGLLFLLAGILMLALPGQGILSILVGLILIDFPGKYAVERRLISYKTVLHTINWIRTKAGKPELYLGEP